jgi:thiol-disulfide isomerase/thioredoxin
MPSTTGIRSPIFARTAVPIALLAAAGLSGCAGGSAAGSGGVTVAAGITQIAPASRTAAPELSGTDLQGAALSLGSYRGQVTVLNVWGSWCAECRVEAASLEETYQRYEARQVRFFGINAHDDDAAALAYVHEFGIGYPSFQDPDETLLLQFKTVMPVADIPSTIIIDGSGRVAVRMLGAVTEPQLAQELDYVLGPAQHAAGPGETSVSPGPVRVS